MADILQSMGILPSRTSDVAAYKGALGRPFLEGYVSQLADAHAFPVVLGGQEFSEALQQTIEQLEYGQLNAVDAQAKVQADAESILQRAAQ
jgi:multiple sugar transport system substrate-binding protein